MKNISMMVRHSTPMKVVSDAQSGYHNTTMPRKISHEATMLVNKLFSELQAIFPAWRNSFPSEASLDHAKKSWVKGFVDSNIKSTNQIKLGVKHARMSTSPHWPSIGAFVAWCKPKPEDLGLMSREDAYNEAIINIRNYITAEWSHVAVQEAVRNTTIYILRNRSEKVSRAEFYRNYDALVNRVICGENLKIDVPKAISEVPKFKRASREVELDHLKNLKKMVGL